MYHVCTAAFPVNILHEAAVSANKIYHNMWRQEIVNSTGGSDNYGNACNTFSSTSSTSTSIISAIIILANLVLTKTKMTDNFGSVRK